MPAACYPVYPAIAARGPLPLDGVTVDTGGVVRLPPRALAATRRGCRCSTCASSSGSASPDVVAAWRDLWLRPDRRAVRPSRARSRSSEIANDPFFGRGRPHARGQPARPGAEVRAGRADRRARADGDRVLQLPPGPLRRRSTASSLDGGGIAHTACLGFGVERITLALLRAHGLDVERLAGRGARGAVAMSRLRRSGDGQPVRPRSGRRTSRTGCTPASGPTSRPTATRTSSSSCCTRAATSRWRRSARSCGWTSRATSGRSSSRPPEDLEVAVRHRHPRDAAVPAAPRADRRAARRSDGR